jgi:hypothetical protein
MYYICIDQQSLLKNEHTEGLKWWDCQNWSKISKKYFGLSRIRFKENRKRKRKVKKTFSLSVPDLFFVYIWSQSINNLLGIETPWAPWSFLRHDFPPRCEVFSLGANTLPFVHTQEWTLFSLKDQRGKQGIFILRGQSSPWGVTFHP